MCDSIQQQPFNGLCSGTTRVGRYQKKFWIFIEQGKIMGAEARTVRVGVIPTGLPAPPPPQPPRFFTVLWQSLLGGKSRVNQNAKICCRILHKSDCGHCVWHLKTSISSSTKNGKDDTTKPGKSLALLCFSTLNECWINIVTSEAAVGLHVGYVLSLNYSHRNTNMEMKVPQQRTSVHCYRLNVGVVCMFSWHSWCLRAPPIRLQTIIYALFEVKLPRRFS